MKRLKTAAVAGIIAVVLAFIGLNALSLNSAPAEERRSLVWPGAGGSSRSGPIKVDVSPELTAEGVACEYLGTHVEVRGALFYKVDKRSVEVKLTTAQIPLQKAALYFTLFDKDDNNIGEGRLTLESDLGAQETQTANVRDVRTMETSRIVISRKSEN